MCQRSHHSCTRLTCVAWNTYLQAAHSYVNDLFSHSIRPHHPAWIPLPIYLLRLRADVTDLDGQLAQSCFWHHGPSSWGLLPMLDTYCRGRDSRLLLPILGLLH